MQGADTESGSAKVCPVKLAPLPTTAERSSVAGESSQSLPVSSPEGVLPLALEKRDRRVDYAVDNYLDTPGPVQISSLDTSPESRTPHPKYRSRGVTMSETSLKRLRVAKKKAVRWRNNVKKFLDNPSSSYGAFVFSTVMMVCIVLSVFMLLLDTVPIPQRVYAPITDMQFREVGRRDFGRFMGGSEIIFTIIFSLEFFLRLSVAREVIFRYKENPERDAEIARQRQWQTPAQLALAEAKRDDDIPFFQDMYNLLDLISVLPWYVQQLLSTGENSEGIINTLRLLRVLRIFKVCRRFAGTEVLLEAVRRVYKPLALPVFFFGVFSFVFGALVFFIEPCYNLNTCEFTNVFGGMYFSIVTMTTVGYGDQVPSLFESRVLAVIIMIFGTIFLSMPLSVIGTEFDAVWNEQNDRVEHAKTLSKKEIDAAMMVMEKMARRKAATRNKNGTVLDVIKMKQTLEEEEDMDEKNDDESTVSAEASKFSEDVKNERKPSITRAMNYKAISKETENVAPNRFMLLNDYIQITQMIAQLKRVDIKIVPENCDSHVIENLSMYTQKCASMMYLLDLRIKQHCSLVSASNTSFQKKQAGNLLKKFKLGNTSSGSSEVKTDEENARQSSNEDADGNHKLRLETDSPKSDADGNHKFRLETGSLKSEEFSNSFKTSPGSLQSPPHGPSKSSPNRQAPSISSLQPRTLLSWTRTKITMMRGEVDFVKQVKEATESNKWSDKVWLALEMPGSSPAAQLLNTLLILGIVVSTLMFGLQTCSQFIDYNEGSGKCQNLVEVYCKVRSDDYKDPGCFPWNGNASDFSQKLRFYCSDNEKQEYSELCYGEGYNFGHRSPSSMSVLSCASGTRPFREQDELPFHFPFRDGNSFYDICQRPECNNAHELLIDLDPSWRILETILAVLFTCELLARIITARNYAVLLFDIFFIIDFSSLLPYYLELATVGDKNVGSWNALSFSVDHTSNPYMKVVKLLKVFRIFKMTRHYSSVNILVETFQLSWRKLVIPFFMLFVCCMIFAVFFHLSEKGHICEVGSDNYCINDPIDLVGNEVDIELTDDTLAIAGEHSLVQVMASGDLTKIPSSFEGLWIALVTVTTVGYGRWGYPIMPWGKAFSVVAMVFGSCYMSMPLFIVGGSFYQCYKNHIQREIVRAKELRFAEAQARRKKEEEEKNKYKVKLTDEQGEIIKSYKNLAVGLDKIARTQQKNVQTLRKGMKIQRLENTSFHDTHLGGLQIDEIEVAHLKLAAPLRDIVDKMRDIHKPKGSHANFGEAAGPLFG